MSDDSEGDFIMYGTPLEPLEDDVCPRKKPFLIQEQVAKDKDGKRRFHGAFTGGFSAGFLNTVGSLEGFKPSSFKSSRSEKGAAIIQKPEDFMDEEDMGEYGIAPSVLRAKEDYQSIETYKRKYPGYLSGPELGNVLSFLLEPVRETVGIKLLKKMGWKPGQGVGPRVTKNEKKRVSRMRSKVYGCALPDQKSDGDDSESSDIDDEDLKNITFAPNDYPFQLITPKNNVFGLGYKGLEKRPILSTKTPVAKSKNKPKNKRTITGQAFGVGALEEEDEDIYSKEDMSQYDFTLGDSAKERASASRPVIGDGLYDIFFLGSKRKVVKDFKPPILPNDFKPVRKVTKFDQILRSQNPKRLTISPERKGTVEEIQRHARKLTESLPSASPDVFTPFAAVPDKQQRYLKFLELLARGRKGEIQDFLPKDMTEWEKKRELNDFEQAAKFYKPLSKAIEDRFTAASRPENLNDPLAPVDRLDILTNSEIEAAKKNMYGDLTRTVEDWEPCSLLCKRFNIREFKSSGHVVKHKKKTAVLDDFELSLQEANAYEGETSTNSHGLRTENQGNRETSSKLPETDVNEKNKKSKETENSELAKLMENKIDLFNAIFQDTDSEEEDAVVDFYKDKITVEYFEPRKPAGEYDKELGMQFEDDIVNDKRNTSPARGIFENIDYDLLLPKKQTTETFPQFDDAVPGPSNYECPESEDDTQSPDMHYGPKLPDKFPEKKSSYAPMYESGHPKEEGVWVEKQVAGHKKHKKTKKRKKSKERSKSKED